MPWEISIVNADDRGKGLGSRQEVISKFAAALPGVDLRQPPSPPPEMLELMPAIIRENMLRPRLAADFEGDGFVIQFYTQCDPEIRWVNAEVRGNGKPLPALAALCIPNRWAVIDAVGNTALDLSADESPEWGRFRDWRDKGIVSLRK